MNKIAVACTVDEHYAKHCTVTLTSLFINNPAADFDVYIVHNNLPVKTIAKMQRSLTAYGNSANFIAIDDELLRDAPVDHHISRATYYRLLLPQVLPASLNKILFLDSDTIVRKPVIGLWEKDVSEVALAASVAAGMHDYPAKLSLACTSLYFNAGVMLINLDYWRKANVLERCIELIANERQRIKWWDQDLLNIIFEGQWLLIELTWNAQPYIFGEVHEETDATILQYAGYGLVDAFIDPAIVHFAGAEKPWQGKCSIRFSPEYKYYLGRTRWAPGIFDTLSNSIKKVYRKLYWQFRIDARRK
ncbi:MAG: glycosyltransferase family 8 protein [Bacteroidota bacterium]